MTHKTIVCSCGKTLSTCRCPAPNKPKVVSDKPCTHNVPGTKPAAVSAPSVAAEALRDAADEFATGERVMERCTRGLVAAWLRDRAHLIESGERS